MNLEKKSLIVRKITEHLTKHIRLLVFAISALSVQQNTMAAVPGLDANFIGGMPAAVNNVGQVVGSTAVNGLSQAWVYTPGIGTTVLPAPEGWGAKAKGISDTGIIVGSVDDGVENNAADGATVWRPNADGYEMSILSELPATDYGSSANNVNSQGDIVGTRTFLTEWTPGRWLVLSRGFVLTHDGIFISNLEEAGFSATPADINDNRQIVGGNLRLNLATGIIDDLSASTTTDGQTLNIIYAYAINESGQVAGMGNNSQGYFPMYYTDGVGWTALTIPGTSSNGAYGINDNGDVLMNINLVCGSSYAPAVYLATENKIVCLQQMLTDQNWQLVFGYAAAGISNSRDTAVFAENQATAQLGAVSLMANGDLAPPLAPANLVATAHEATPTQPFIAIDLAWTDQSDNEFGFRIERALSPQSELNPWLEVGNVNANVWGFRDLSIEPLATYDYRVVAKGAGGESVSNIATIASPSPLDVTAPSVTIVTPTDEATVSGNFSIEIVADDGVNVPVGIVVMEMELNGELVNICTILDPSETSVTCTVNAKKHKLKNNALIPISVKVYDDMENMANASVSVTWTNGDVDGGTGKGNGRGKK